MNQEQAAALADITTLIAKMNSDPVIIRYNKLRKFAESVGLRIDPKRESFEIKDAKGKVLFKCDTTGEMNDWFKENYLEDVL